MAGMVTSDSGDDTTSRNCYVAGMDQASDSDSNDESSSFYGRVCKNNILQAHPFQAEKTGGTKTMLSRSRELKTIALVNLF